MPPPSSSYKVNPEIRPASSRKRKVSRRAIENADPLVLNKRQKTTVNSVPTYQDADTETHRSSPSTQTSSVAPEEAGDDANGFVPSTQAIDELLAGLARGSESSDSDENEIKSVIDVDNVLEVFEESAEAQLSKFVAELYYHQPKYFRRATYERLERTCIRLFQTRA